MDSNQSRQTIKSFKKFDREHFGRRKDFASCVPEPDYNAAKGSTRRHVPVPCTKCKPDAMKRREEAISAGLLAPFSPLQPPQPRMKRAAPIWHSRDPYEEVEEAIQNAADEMFRPSKTPTTQIVEHGAMSDEETYFALLREWLKTCLLNHRHRSLEPHLRSGSPQMPKRLLYIGLDWTQKLYLSETESLLHTIKPPLVSYTTLSHRWGNDSDRYVTTSANIENRQKHLRFSELPKTFQDAVIVTRQLGFHYIWIDSLCIVQDAELEKEEEIQKMEDTYFYSFCNLAAAAASTPNDGFLFQPRYTASDIESHSETISFISEIENAELNKRGWVLQERALARRTIHFGRKQTYWECDHGIACESRPLIVPGQQLVNNLLGSSFFPQSPSNTARNHPHLIFDIFCRFSKLGLTNERDRIWAIAALEYRLATYYHTLTVYGIFAKFFHQSLLWHRHDIVSALTPINHPNRRTKPPSWSWMAYSGPIHYYSIDVESAQPVDAEFLYSNTENGTRVCILRGLLATYSTEDLEKLDQEHGVHYDDGRTEHAETVLSIVPLLRDSKGVAFGLIVETRKGRYLRAGVASLPLGVDFASLDRVNVF